MRDGDAPGAAAGDRPRLRGLAEEAAGYLPHAAVALAATAGIAAMKQAEIFRGLNSELQLGTLAVLTLLLAPVRARDVAAPLRILHRTATLLFAVYALAAYPAVSDYYMEVSLHSELLLRWTGPAAAAAAALAWFRPGFALAPFLLVTWKKEQMARLFGFPLNSTDYYPVAELGVFLCLLIGAAAAMERFGPRLGMAVPGKGGDRRWSLGEGAFLFAFAVHLANYFWSAIAKVTLPGAGPLTWVLENDTHDIMLATAASGLGPLLAWDGIAWASHELMHRFHPVTNAATYLLQLASVLAFLRLRGGALLTGLYDLMHLMIFLTTSILFWKWMTVNLGLILAIRSLRGREAPWPLKAMATATVLAAPLVFWVAWLGWFDTKALNRPSVEAVTEDGRSVPVPSTFFLEGSAQMAKAVIGAPFEGHFQDIGVFGKAERGFEQMVAARDCALPVGEESGLSRTFAGDPRLERYFVEHHRFVLAHAGEDGRYPYSWFPHHNWANPALYAEFDALDLRDVVAYRYIIDSICLGYDGAGGVTETLKLRGTHEIPVR